MDKISDKEVLMGVENVRCIFGDVGESVEVGERE